MASVPFITDDWDEEAAGICWRPKAASALLDGSSCEAVGACTGTAASAAAALDVGSFGRSGRTAEVLCCAGVTRHGRVVTAVASVGLQGGGEDMLSIAVGGCIAFLASGVKFLPGNPAAKTFSDTCPLPCSAAALATAVRVSASTAAAVAGMSLLFKDNNKRLVAVGCASCAASFKLP